MSTPLPAHADPLLHLERRARRRVGMKLGFMIHAIAFLLVNAGLYALNEMAGGPRWFPFPLLGWGLGLAIHGLVVGTLLSTDGLRRGWVQREMQRLLARNGAA